MSIYQNLQQFRICKTKQQKQSRQCYKENYASSFVLLNHYLTLLHQIKQQKNKQYRHSVLCLPLNILQVICIRFDNQNMFCILPCGTIKDKVTLPPVGTTSAIAPQMDVTRNQIRKLSDIGYLLQRLNQGQVIMSRKVAFDNYLAAHVDLMKAYVSTFTPCNFAYSSFFTSQQIPTTGLSQRDQWALEIVMTRYNLSSIYQAGSYSSMRTIFTEVPSSYKDGAKTSPQLIKDIQVTFQYFNEGYQPLKRLLPYFDAVESLASPTTKSKYPELNHTIFQVYSSMVTINLAYLKIEKCRLLRQFKRCKQASWAVYLRIMDCKSKLNTVKGQFQGLSTEMTDFFDLGELFYQMLAYYFMLLEHEQVKNIEEYGFIKKEFQQMIYDNLVAVDEAERLMGVFSGLKSQNDNVTFGMGVLRIVIQEIKRYLFQYTGLNIDTIYPFIKIKWNDRLLGKLFREGWGHRTFGNHLISFDLNILQYQFRGDV